MFVILTMFVSLTHPYDARQHRPMGIDPRYEAFGRAVALRRDKLDMTQAQLASRVGLSRASIANMEAGRQNVLLHHACDIAAVLNLDHVDDLMPVLAHIGGSDQDLPPVSDESISSRSRVQINDMIVNAMASAKVKS
jgi:DNA-binding XRE family transcriptional regulator